MQTWPSSLPQTFLNTNYSDELPNQLVRNPIDELDSEVRRTGRHEVKAPISATFLMTTNQWNELQEWFEGMLGYGALHFNFPNHESDTGNITLAFTRPPKLAGLSGKYHIVSVNLERV